MKLIQQNSNTSVPVVSASATQRPQLAGIIREASVVCSLYVAITPETSSSARLAQKSIKSDWPFQPAPMLLADPAHMFHFQKWPVNEYMYWECKPSNREGAGYGV